MEREELARMQVWRRRRRRERIFGTKAQRKRMREGGRGRPLWKLGNRHPIRGGEERERPFGNQERKEGEGL